MSIQTGPLERNIRILEFLQSEGGDGRTAKQIAKALGCELPITKFHLQNLRTKRYVIVDSDSRPRKLYKPTAKSKKLLVDLSISSASPEIWDYVHREIQGSLGVLALSVGQIPARLRPGRTSSRTFPLFSYLTFEPIDGREDESIVAGVTIATTAEGRLEVSADISGEESGRVFFDVAGKHVESDPAEILREAVGMAKQLAKGASNLQAALR